MLAPPADARNSTNATIWVEAVEDAGLPVAPPAAFWLEIPAAASGDASLVGVGEGVGVGVGVGVDAGVGVAFTAGLATTGAGAALTGGAAGGRAGSAGEPEETPRAAAALSRAPAATWSPEATILFAAAELLEPVAMSSAATPATCGTAKDVPSLTW